MNSKILLVSIIIFLVSCTTGQVIKETPTLELEGPYMVTYTVDGDTADVIINGTKERLRFSGINTPETNECYYQEAKDKLRELILDKEVYLEKDISNRGNYGRLLRYIYLDENTMVNEILVNEGYAKVYDKYKDDTKRWKQLKRAEADAYLEKLGVWSCN